MKVWRSATRVSSCRYLSITRIAWPAALSPRQHGPDLLADERRALGGFVAEDQQMPDWSASAVRWRASAARRPRAGCPCCRHARPGAETARRTPSSVQGLALPLRRSRSHQVSRTLRLGKICRPSGTIAEAHLRDALRGAAVDALAEKADLALPGGQLGEYGFQRGACPCRCGPAGGHLARPAVPGPRRTAPGSGRSRLRGFRCSAGRSCGGSGVVVVAR